VHWRPHPPKPRYRRDQFNNVHDMGPSVAGQKNRARKVPYDGTRRHPPRHACFTARRK
jgi:hypothetical protein